MTSNEKYVEIDASQVPVLDETSLSSLKKLARHDLRFVQFEDNLKIFSLSGNDIGDFSISVTPTVYRNMQCFKVKAKSFGTLDDAPCGTDINAYVNENFETIEQDYKEFIKLPKYQLVRRTTITLENDRYLINRMEKTDKDILNSNFSIKKSLMAGYVSESSNIIIQRLMIQNNRLDSLTLFTFDSEINPCVVNYNALDTRIIQVEDYEYHVRGIERTIESISDIPTTWQIYFSSDGHMINRVQIGYPAVIKAVTRPKAIEIDDFLPRPIIEKKELNLDTDMQLKSNYLDRKEELKNEYDQYMHDHPELKSLISDYMQSILSIKPDDVVAFTSKFFAPYSSKTKSNNLLPYLDQKINIPNHQKKS